MAMQGEGPMAPLKVAIHEFFGHFESLYEGFLTVRDGAVSTGCVMLDGRTGGLKPGELTVVAGVPGSGKTSVLLALAAAAADGDRATLIGSLQWPLSRVAMRLVARQSGVSATTLSTHTMRDHQWPRLTAAAGRLASSHLHCLDQLPGGLDDLRRCARSLVSEPNLALLTVDHAALIPPPNGVCSCQALPGTVRGLRALARDLHIPVVAALELTAPDGVAPCGPPTLADLVARGVEPTDVDDLWLLHTQDEDAPEPLGRDEARWFTLEMHRREGWTRSVRLLFAPATLQFHGPFDVLPDCATVQ